MTVQITSQAHQALAANMRRWSGWNDSTLVLGPTDPKVSPFATTDLATRTFTLNPETLVLNPNRVIRTVTPFRLRQEGVLTGAMLHEAAHARFTRWMPRTPEAAKALRLSDGTAPTEEVVALARVLEEPRIERRMTFEAQKFGGAGLEWTMQASAMHLLPPTTLSADPDQKIMDLVTSWILRAGRRYAIGKGQERWVQTFDWILHEALTDHLNDVKEADELMWKIRFSVIGMGDAADTGTEVLDRAKSILTALFPETEDGTGAPMPQAGCCGGQSSPDASDSTEDESESGEGESESGEGESESESESGEGESGEGDTLASALGKIEAAAEQASDDEAEEQSKSAAAPQAGGEGGAGQGSTSGGWRQPGKDERDLAKSAEKFLRDLISPSESSKITRSDSPSSTVDPAALSAWKAGGGTTAPTFFRRTRREASQSPPVKIAVLVDISGSMDVMQRPSSVLSWALSSAALDLANFAGRGQQIETTLIHWGSDVKVVQPAGQTLPGIRQVPCNEGTSVLHLAMDEVENQIPGFFETPEKPTNRLLVNFTDWELMRSCIDPTTERVSKALASGVNMISVVPGTYSDRWTVLPHILREARIQRGTHTLIRYDPTRPHQVWEGASRALA